MPDPVDRDQATATAALQGGAGADAGPRVAELTLLVTEGPAAGTTWVSSTERCTIGSHASNDLVVGDRTVSRFHCELALTGGRIAIRDLGSRNGTLVDGVLIERAYLREGSLVRLGGSALRLSLSGAQAVLAVSPRSAFGTLVGGSVAMRSAFHVLERAAATDATVLLEGETGTGKDAAAEALHAASARSSGPFIVVDCGSIPGNLIESELFGHEKGAFTGATAAKVGAFEAAHGGTLFLDEVGELPLDLQPKLLRALESRTVQRVGGRERKAIDVRVVAATNRDLRKAVNDGTFRPDLFFRLAVVGVRMPALRDRPEDLTAVATRLLERLGADDVTRARLMTPEFVRRLERHPWSGNVRELRNYLEQCLVFESPPPLMSVEPQAVLDPDLRGTYAEARRRALDAFERRFVRALLDQTGGNVSEAARRADVARGYLHRLLKRHGA